MAAFSRLAPGAHIATVLALLEDRGPLEANAGATALLAQSTGLALDDLGVAVTSK